MALYRVGKDSQETLRVKPRIFKLPEHAWMGKIGIVHLISNDGLMCQ